MNKMGDSIKPANILIVDDIAENLQVLSGMLKGEGYMVRPVPSGKLALLAAKSEPPDLILLDITMPEMDGYEVCQQLKNNPDLKEIPVIFISALTEVFDKVKAFSVGGVDYITKPFQFEEVSARVKTHLALRRSQQDLRVLLAKTFISSLRTMTDILSMVAPVIFDQSNRLKRYVHIISEYLEISPRVAWHLEMAAMLSQIGCVTLPKGILEKKQQGMVLTADEDRQFHQHPLVAAELMGDIPRLEHVVGIIKGQLDPFVGEPIKDIHKTNTILLGSRMLHMVIEYDYLMLSGKNSVAALLVLTERLRDYSPILLKALRFVVEQEAKETVRSVRVQDLATGMILMEDVMTEAGLLILHRSNELSPNLLSLLKHYAMLHKIREPISVMDRCSGK